MFCVSVYLILILGLLVLFLIRNNKNEALDKIPGPRGTFLVENALDFLANPVELFKIFMRISQKYGDIFKVKMGPKTFVVISNPEDVEVLISGMENTEKGYLYSFIEPWLQNGLLLSDGKKWHQRRKILTQAFHFNILQHFHTLLNENCSKLVESLQHEIGQPKTDIASYIIPYTLHSICETAMGTKLDKDSGGDIYKDSIIKLCHLIVYRVQRLWLYPNFTYYLTSVGKQQKKFLNYMSSFRDNVIDKRRKSEEHNKLLLEITNNTCEIDTKSRKKLAMLDLLLQAEKNGMIDAKGIGEEVDTFMFEGHDTTASALQFIFMLLANHSESQDKIVEECNQIFGTTSRAATMNDLAQMKYLECCIKESLRLYPPVYFMSRKVTQTTTLSNFEIPAGSDCTILMYRLHRHKQFIDPFAFRPERFTEEVHTWHPFAYIPFSAGPRNCIGQKFAMMEMKLAVSSVLRRFKLMPITKPEDINISTDIILRVDYPIYVKIEPRILEV